MRVCAFQQMNVILEVDSQRLTRTRAEALHRREIVLESALERRRQ